MHFNAYYRRTHNNAFGIYTEKFTAGKVNLFF